ncbi:uncharacterized protein LOC121398216 [Xenopus laevis]|uniref:Uncharacterized protein LOC121398216 n=1 Tax=Xenopus laevis TaxID=8355 RepID=A0A8J1LVF0_XENLA|nr:uncharacterized protein LOC121398216 [Xenopus laevis]OCT59088.1 hypothetical protein XELAEV_18001576mg [Xenopus laevis]
MTEPDQASDLCCASTFVYSDEDIQRILKNIEEGEIPLSGSTVACDIKKELLNLQKKEISLNLHVVSLAQYVRAKRIPRGLRVDLKPNLCAEDPILIQRWQEICNKCSLDLILTVERLQAKLCDIRSKIGEAKEQISRDKGAEQAASIFKDHEEILSKHREIIAERKHSKFERDAQDYRLNQVYTWREDRRNQRQQQYSPQKRNALPWRQRGTGRYSRGAPRGRQTQRECPDTYRSTPREDSSSSDFSSTGFLSQDYLPQPARKKNPRAPIQRESYPSRQKDKR